MWMLDIFAIVGAGTGIILIWQTKNNLLMMKEKKENFPTVFVLIENPLIFIFIFWINARKE